MDALVNGDCGMPVRSINDGSMFQMCHRRINRMSRCLRGDAAAMGIDSDRPCGAILL